ncbi:hypothetical protein, partial [Maribacter sp. 2304DJ31-5]|uniref:hypothetical protein n=1 Tax=Maribacter sp. 2304DJ31-5 TaxID=3386273 RepID=UPI0039BD0FC4
LADNSDTDFPTEQAVKTYVDNQISGVTAPTIVSADTPNSITAGTDGGARYDDTPLVNATTANATATAANTTALAGKEDTANKSTDGTLADNSDTDFPTEQAVKTYVDTQIASNIGDMNLSNSDLTLNADRTVNLAGNELNFSGSGNIGIGNLPGAPQDKLDVDGQIRARNGFASTEGSAGNPGYGFYTNGDTDMGMYRIAADQLGFSTGGVEAIRIDASQNVGIGINPTERLHVNGNILASGTITPDYVFQLYFNGKSELNPDYQMLSLREIEKFIRKNKHLPDVPSANQVKEQGGILVNRSTEINLEKIEELFLHTIEQEKKIKALKSKNESLSQQMESLQAQMEEIKKMLVEKIKK